MDKLYYMIKRWISNLFKRNSEYLFQVKLRKEPENLYIGDNYIVIIF